MQMQIAEITQVGSGCPTAWDVVLEDGRQGYIRYRGGFLSFDVELFDKDPKQDRHKDTFPTDIPWLCIYGKTIGDRFDGFIEWEKVLERLGDLDVDAAIADVVKKDNEHLVNMHDPEYRKNYWETTTREIWISMSEMCKELNGQPWSKGGNYVATDEEIEQRVKEAVEKSEEEWQAEHGK